MTTTLGAAPRDLRRLWVRGLIWRAPADLPLLEMQEVSRAAMVAARPAAQVLGGRDSVFVHHLESYGDVVVKEYRRGGHVSPFVRLHHLRRGPSRGEREFRNLRAVRDMGVHAPEPLAFVSRGLLIYRSWLVTRLVPNQGSLAAISLADTDRLERLVVATARQVAPLLSGGVLHADLHPGNVIVGIDEVPCLLDFDRAFRFHGSPRELCRRYVGRWARAVRKHALPEVLDVAFRDELARWAGTSPARVHDIAPVQG